jgi:hypothetical protein
MEWRKIKFRKKKTFASFGNKIFSSVWHDGEMPQVVSLRVANHPSHLIHLTSRQLKRLYSLK